MSLPVNVLTGRVDVHFHPVSKINGIENAA